MRDDKADRFSVMTLNMRFGLANDGPNRWELRKSLFPMLLDAYRSDFMAFQEANDFQSEDLQEMLPGYEVIGIRKPAPRFWQNNILFYDRNRWDCLLNHHFFLSPTPDIPSRFRKSRWPRQCTTGLFFNGRYHLTVITTHFDFDTEVQTAGSRLIVKRLADYPEDVPVVLTGDFNAGPHSPCYAVFCTPEGATNVQAAFRNAFSAPYPPTHHGFTGAQAGDHIDWILYRGPIKPEIARIMDTPIEGRWPSDHFPLQTVFSRKRNPGPE
jgi:endonuclease/exonuclease/phosphatase family metal-dependent hydrolase